jgi:hypothetical protein
MRDCDTTGLLQSDCHWEDDLMFAEMVAKQRFHFIQLISAALQKRVVDYMFSNMKRPHSKSDMLCNRIS